MPQFRADGLFFATHRAVPVASACAWRDPPDESRVGIVHMVCVLPGHRGHGLGRQLTLALLHWFRAHGFKAATLATDDWRLAAIREYLRLGFEPIVTDEISRARWQHALAAASGGRRG
jgi:mycothiol synthase